jgi:hypothetical protein
MAIVTQRKQDNDDTSSFFPHTKLKNDDIPMMRNSNKKRQNNRMNHEGEKKISQKTIGAVKVAASPSSSPPHPVSRRQRRFTKNFFVILIERTSFLGNADSCDF